MALFIDVPTIGQLVSKVGIKDFMQGLTTYLEEDFSRWEEWDKSPRAAAHSDVGVIELMPVADDKLYGFKYVNGHPKNPEQGLSTVMAFGALSEVSTGLPLLLSELTVSTAFRTAATSVMAAKALARKDSQSMAMIGCGSQSEFQLLTFHYLLGITIFQIYDVDPLAMEKLMNHMTDYPELKVIRCESAKEAVIDVDIITTCTADKRKATILTPDMVKAGQHINAIGGDCPGKTELDKDVLTQGKIFIEHEPQTRVEGDIQQLPADYPVHPLWKAVVDPSQFGRESNEQITIFDSVGFALEDLSVLRYVYDLAKKHEMGEYISLVPWMDNPKDLFGLTKNGSVSKKVSKVS